ncbi:iron dicitrate transporter FecR [Spirochaetia bacterium]|nr:iron dicitrate transporter FecR [Spirochaetia bacterium]
MKHTSVFLMMLIALFCGMPLCAQDLTALIQEMNGTVEVKQSGSSVWAPARQGMRLEKSSAISTGVRSSAVLLIGDSKVIVRPITRLSIEEIAARQGSEQVNLFLQTGKVRGEVKPPAGGRTNFSVRSPSATASVRGTVFEFNTQKLTVQEGQVRYAPTQGGPTAQVRAGESSSIAGGGQVSSPHNLAEAVRPQLPPGSENGASFGGAAAAGDGATESGLTPPSRSPAGTNLDIVVKWE